MKERPILFSAPMVRAILDGRKTQTRRVVKVPPSTRSVRWVENAELVPSGGYTGWVIECDAPLLLPRQCPYGVPGDRLWVRESFDVPYRQNFPGDRSAVVYRADYLRPTFLDPCVGDDPSRWSRSIHMPRWASRITLEVTGVRVERLQGISEEDAMAEGAPPILVPPDGGSEPHVEGFRDLWESINGSGSWDANPWVWVIEFAKVAGAA